MSGNQSASRSEEKMMHNNMTITLKLILLPIFLLFAAIIASPLLLSDNIAYAQRTSGLAGTTFPPPVFYTIRSQPSYEISIPFSAGEKAAFAPQYVNIPVGMTVIWFNNDAGEHSVITLTNSTYSPPETINSGAIESGGSFIHQFSAPGRYVYFDQFAPSIHGVINVGSAIETGKYFNMHIGGINSIPFNPSKLKSVVLTFVPKTVSFPPVSDITYNITLLNSTGKTLYSHTYLTSDGILDLDLVPAHKSPLSLSSATHSPKNTTAVSSAQQFTTWGPDFIGQVPTATTGTFHIRGPLFIQNSPYSIKVSIIGKDNRIFPSPISETFVLPPNINK
jgi:plastocyanin